MPTSAAPDDADGIDPRHDQGAVERFDRSLDHWRARIDELKVQIELATLDVREAAKQRLEVTENVYLALRSRLGDLRGDAGSNAAGLRRSADQLVTDLRRAFDDAQAVLRRGRQGPTSGVRATEDDRVAPHS